MFFFSPSQDEDPPQLITAGGPSLGYFNEMIGPRHHLKGDMGVCQHPRIRCDASELEMLTFLPHFCLHKKVIDRLRKTGDAAGHKTDPCGAGNDHFFCPTGTGPKDITARFKSSIIP